MSEHMLPFPSLPYFPVGTDGGSRVVANEV